MRRLAFVLVLLAGCAGQQLSPDQQMAATCSSYADALNTANAFYSQMSENERATVDASVSTIGPVCDKWGRGELVSTLDLVNSLQATLASLLAVTEERGQ